MQKNKWWADRKKAAESAAAGHNFKAFPTVPIPAWTYGKSVSLDSLKSVTDSYVKTLEPKRKLVLPVLPATVKDSLAAFTASIKQDKSLPEIQNMLVQALADKAVVEENGRMLEGFKVRSTCQKASAWTILYRLGLGEQRGGMVLTESARVILSTILRVLRKLQV